MQLTKLIPTFDALQKKYGDTSLTSIYGAGCIKNPEICFVFMNPTGRNVAADPTWTGLRAPWIGTKNVWKLFSRLNLIEQKIFEQIQKMHPLDWDPTFSQTVYKEIQNKNLYVTNLAKCTQSDARHLPDAIFREYLPLLFREIEVIKPKKIITFGNQVSSILLGTPIQVSRYRKTMIPLAIGKQTFPVYPSYYPVGQGMRNIDKAIEDLQWILNHKNPTV